MKIKMKMLKYKNLPMSDMKRSYVKVFTRKKNCSKKAVIHLARSQNCSITILTKWHEN